MTESLPASAFIQMSTKTLPGRVYLRPDETESPRKLWIALFSQSGSELVAICEKLGRFPDAILTNNLKRDFTDSVFVEKNLLKTYDTESLFNVLREVQETIAKDHEVVITLHGFLRILPEDICESFEIYNGHPGDIINSPELKGKDPQAKALKLGHKTARAVLHKVVPEVDAGDIVRTTPYVYIDDNTTLDSLIDELKSYSVDEWVELLRERL